MMTPLQHEKRPSVEHFSNVTTEEYTDGQAFLDILKLLPSNSSLVHCIRSYQLYRFSIGLDCISEVQISRLQKYTATYERDCKHIQNDHNKDFAFYKQHACAHAIDDIHDKGVPAGYSTRPGEGFHQELKDLVFGLICSTQLARIDENKEAFARIRMAIDAYDAVNSMEGDECEEFTREGADLHWSLGSPLKWTTAEELGQKLKDKNFATDLRRLLNEFVVDQALQPDVVIKIKPYRCIQLKYQSCVNWTEETDILRCNPNLHGNPRYGHALVNDKPEDLTVAPGRIVALSTTRRTPKTKWAGCRVYDEKKSLDLVLVKYLIRGAHMIPVSDANKPSLTCLNDLIDGDMLVRAGN
ncbi:hypothetical protein B0H13DRAFT_2664685 [Mycena leptocephala]|nr:hypothetical protein B0H13DRAFT_2664685 [Mycena leptocephala]